MVSEAIGDEAAVRRRGRPPDTDSADTRRMIFDAARRLFGERGYGAVTNKDVASAAGITTGALYHYVESKLDLYVAVDDDVQRLIYDRFQRAVDSSATFLGQLGAVLEAAHDMGAQDPTLAAFVGAVRTDTRRFPEVAERLAHHSAQRDSFFTGIVDVGIETGEIAPENKPLVVEVVRNVLIGLTETTSYSPVQHLQAIEGIKALFRGTLVAPVDE